MRLSLLPLLLVAFTFGGSLSNAMLFDRNGNNCTDTADDACLTDFRNALTDMDAYIAPDIQVTQVPTSGLGVIAMQDLDEKTVLLRLPAYLRLQIEDVHSAFPEWKKLDGTILDDERGLVSAEGEREERRGENQLFLTSFNFFPPHSYLFTLLGLLAHVVTISVSLIFRMIVGTVSTFVI
jgi:hypothetical protein